MRMNSPANPQPARSAGKTRREFLQAAAGVAEQRNAADRVGQRRRDHLHAHVARDELPAREQHQHREREPDADALERRESCSGHFRSEYQDDEGEAQRDDDNFAHVAAWEFSGDPMTAVRHKEELEFETIHLAKRSYK